MEGGLSMRHIPVRRILPPLAVVLLVTAGLIYLSTVSGAAAGPLRSSGTIESIEVGVASEMPGRVSEVLVDEGQTVAAGEPVIRLDSRLLETQRRSAQAAGEAAFAAAQMELTAAQQALEDLHDNAPTARAQAQQALATARDALDEAQRDYTYNQEGNRATSETLKAAKAKLAVERERMEYALETYNRTRGDLADGKRKAQAYLAYNNARIAYDKARSAYNWYTGHPSEIDQAQFEADVAVAQAQVDDARRQLEDLRLGPDPDALALARARLTLASAQLAAARAKADLDLELLDLQLEKLVITAPLDGVVLTRTIEPGEVLAAGAPALSIGTLDQLTITVYLAEDRYGELSLGDEATVTVDSFPGLVFAAHVVRIADKAEFTPRNVQTEEGRRNTVFAVELAVDDSSSRLKPGMPADVEFITKP
jgi:HlyD family secretion protein